MLVKRHIALAVLSGPKCIFVYGQRNHRDGIV